MPIFICGAIIFIIRALHGTQKGAYFATATERTSRMTVIFTCPG